MHGTRARGADGSGRAEKRGYVSYELFWGEKVKVYIDKYFGWLTVIFAVLLVGGFLLLQKVF